MQNKEHVVLKTEIEDLKKKYLFEGCFGKELLLRRKLYQVTKRYLTMMGFIKKHYRALDQSEQVLDGYQLCFKHMDFLTDSNSEGACSINEGEYFASRRCNFPIHFIQEPVRSSTQSFENSGYAMMKGRNWNYFM